jgi:hypothetical protein
MEVFFNKSTIERKFSFANECRYININGGCSLRRYTSQWECLEPFDLSSRIVRHPQCDILFVVVFKRFKGSLI